MPVRALGSFLPAPLGPLARRRVRTVCFNAREGSGVFSTTLFSEAPPLSQSAPGFNAREGSGVFSTGT